MIQVPPTGKAVKKTLSNSTNGQCVDVPACEAGVGIEPGWSEVLRAKPRVREPKFYGPLKAGERTYQEPARIFISRQTRKFILSHKLG